MTSVSTVSTAQFEAGIDRLCRRDIDGRTLLRALASHVSAAIPAEGLLFLRTDPTTVLPTDGVVDALPPALCKHFWDNELLEADYNKFVELARREISAATLSEATAGDLLRSRRYAQLYRPLRFGDELRASFTARDGSCWGIAQLVRSEGGTFSEDERDLLAGVSPVVAEGLRAACASSQQTARPPHAGPALVLMDENGDIQATTAEAKHWLAELVRSSATPMRPVPEPVYLVAGRARAAQAGISSEPASVQVRTGTGVWLHLHAAHVDGSEGPSGAVAVVITPGRAPDLAPLIALAYRVTAREQDVLQFIARGLTTAEMAQQLGISHHTVRDHVKALFQKVGVRSRTELVARIFADHYFERLKADADVLSGTEVPLSENH
jgi:DNA-binding CsgD family transcriptional regulator